MESERETALAALADIGRQRRLAADRLATPWWYHPVLGLLVGGFVATRAIDSNLVQALALAAFFAGLGLLVTAYRRITGVWVSGYRRGPAGRVTALLVVAYVAAIAGAYLAEGAAAFLAAGAAVAVVTVVLGRRFDDAVREELLR